MRQERHPSSFNFKGDFSDSKIRKVSKMVINYTWDVSKILRKKDFKLK
jgi:hypothetical protein